MDAIELTRDCEAVQIPEGNPMTLGKGTALDITQTLGGTYTVRAGAGLFRIGAQDADALGLEVAETAGTEGPVNVEAVQAMLKNCYDPEIPVNIFDLGLIYEVDVTPEEVSVVMTLTSPSCPSAPEIPQSIETKVIETLSAEKCLVHVVWDPPWTPQKITPEGKKILGMDTDDDDEGESESES